MATVGVLCGRMRVEEKLLVAALVEAGVPAEPVVPAGLPLPPSRSPLPPAPAITGGPPTDLLLDRFPDRSSGSALIFASRATGSVTIDAGVAATGDRLAVATALAAAGVARPDTQFAWSAEAALAAVVALGCPATLLPLAFRSAPASLLDLDAAEAVIEHRAVLGNGVETLSLVQAGVVAGHSSRFIVVDGESVAVEGGDLGMDADAGRHVAALAAHALGARLIGVEVAATDRGLVVWDVQPVPGFRHVRSLTGRTVADAVAAMAVRMLAAREPRTERPSGAGHLAILAAAGSANGSEIRNPIRNGHGQAEEVRGGAALFA
jgi:hypothetical protein